MYLAVLSDIYGNREALTALIDVGPISAAAARSRCRYLANVGSISQARERCAARVCSA